jgi:hypothetical protein
MDCLLDELQLAGDASAQARQAALLRFLMLEEAGRQGITATPGMLRAAAETFRRERGMEDPAAFQAWLAENQLSQDEFQELMKAEAALAWVRDQTEIDTAAQLSDCLRMTGQYARLVSRAREKQHWLESQGLEHPSVQDAGLTEEELLRWYFEERLGRAVPSNLASYIRLAGFADEHSFERAILREYCYTKRPPII